MRDRALRRCILPLTIWVLVGGSGPATGAASVNDDSAPRLRVVREDIAGQPLGVTGIRLVPAAIESLRVAEEAIVEGFPLPERQPVQLELRAVQIVRPDARFVAVDEHGERAVEALDVLFFRGRVRGDEDSSVALLIHDETIAGRVVVNGESFGFGRRSPGSARDAEPELQVWNQLFDGDAPALDCETEERGNRESRRDRPAPKSVTIDPDTLLDATVAIDATTEWFDRLGSLEAAQLHILDLIQQTSAVYEQDVGVRLTVGYMRIFTAEPDPYDGSSGTLTLLGQLRDEWNANLTHVDRALVHLFDIQQGSGGAGRAFVDALCESAETPGNSRDYGLSRIQAEGRLWELRMVAHELGHVFSSPHTHCYDPEIDRCASANGCYAGSPQSSLGTIMSYCNQYEVVFHPRVRDERIRPAAEAATASCLGLPARPGAIASDGASSAPLMLDRGSRSVVSLSWGPPCNAEEVGDQDFAIYRGTLGNWHSVEPVTCSTNRSLEWSGPEQEGFFLVVPATGTHEGSYGRTSDGLERSPAVQACRPQSIADCS